MQVLRHAPVRRHHEVFDEIARAVALGDGEVDDFAIYDDGRCFDALEVQRPRRFASAAQAVRSFVLQTKLLAQLRVGRDRCGRWPVPLEPQSDGAIRELRVIVHESVVDRLARQAAICGHRELHDECKAIDVFVERGKIGREPLGKHGEHRDARVDGRGVRRRVIVGRRARRYERRYIGNAQPHDDGVVVSAFDMLDLIEIPRPWIVDRRPQQ